MAETVEIVEVGPRDGLQNEARAIPVSEKVALVDCLSRAGFRRIECASFVSPKWVPQMAGSAQVLAGITRAPGVLYTALTPNLRGLEDALVAGADEVAVFGAASEGFSRANINASIDESLARFRPVVETARTAGLGVRGYVSCVTHCPYDGPVAPAAVARVAAELFDMGCTEISLGETLGRAQPEEVGAMLDAVLHEIPVEHVAGHFHDTGGRALANVERALSHGLRIFDASVGGLGGCPYAPGAAGNVATGALAAHLAGLGHETGLDMEVLAEAGALAREMRS
ncbi:hydroxymethylglutaryl-CoA lyase [Pseudooceanicola antarcticus]|uniref:Hydroxymethylglutaryl-CoA lyase n=1 Tax=Pseudooceanicola antarcticus TaxID=1247613 RepID=A0A285J502_9RHOB|nr:hydroxymethylglutaryl-CoA lyase [Pseudooceanicola antarcticus]PJE29772.1 hydroxymethylglutaryl-CoA lyase [Pseudooceanicola antarcticus]SNY54446.1 hydroxymethylglutaryl-CoA lyase [Pseudooceanicola antarcticus]